MFIKHTIWKLGGGDIVAIIKKTILKGALQNGLQDVYETDVKSTFSRASYLSVEKAFPQGTAKLAKQKGDFWHNTSETDCHFGKQAS